MNIMSASPSIPILRGSLSSPSARLRKNTAKAARSLEWSSAYLRLDRKSTTTAKTKATRKPDMKAYSLSKEEVDALVGYLAALKKP